MMITCGVVLLNLMSLQSLTRWTLAFHHLLANITVWLNPSVWTERWCLRMNWNLSCCWVQHYNVTEANAHQICCLILKYDLINQKVTILSSDNRLYLFFRSQMYLCHNFALCFSPSSIRAIFLLMAAVMASEQRAYRSAPVTWAGQRSTTCCRSTAGSSWNLKRRQNPHVEEFLSVNG